jgi:D-lactate dehydrogenase (cytochrome)
MAFYSISLEIPSPTSYPQIQTDPEILNGRKKDAAGLSGCSLQGVFTPQSEAELACFLADHPYLPLLPQGARTSLTGGATPQGDYVVSFEKLQNRSVLDATHIRVGAGVYLRDLLAWLAEKKLYYPPVPTFDGATLGGTVATNAAGAATFKYGSTRDWVSGFRLVLRNGDILVLTRGQYQVHPGDTLILQGKRKFSFQIPFYHSPPLKKISLGYYVQPEMDLLDFFIGSEGTLGCFSEVDLHVIPAKPHLLGLVFFSDENAVFPCVRALRNEALDVFRKADPLGLDIRSIEFFDRRSLRFIQESWIPKASQAGILFEMELPLVYGDFEKAEEELICLLEGKEGVDSPLKRLRDFFQKWKLLEALEIAFSQDRKRYSLLNKVRESIPIGVNEWIAQQQQKYPTLHKCAGDMVVPFERFEDMWKAYLQSFQSRHLDFAIWGHLSDGNVHPNVLPRSPEEMELGKAALLELATLSKTYGGAPLSEHGVGRHPLKQKMLQEFYGETVIQEMRKIRNLFDPHKTLAQGVLFPPDTPSQTPQ